jgi:hypothetical protein
MAFGNAADFAKTDVARQSDLSIRHWLEPESRRWRYGDRRTASGWQGNLDAARVTGRNALTMESPNVKLLDQVRGKIRLKHYSIRTEQAYVDWIKRFILHFGKRHPRELGAADVEAFLTHLAVAGNVAASTQNQAKSALLFLYREVLETELPWLDNVERARHPSACRWC